MSERAKDDLIGQPSRRGVTLGGVALGAAVGAGIGTGMISFGALDAVAQRRRPAPAEVALEDLMKPGELPDIVIGKADAPVTIVEFASMSCGACAAFHVRELPKLKEKYIDTGKVRLIFREFPLNRLAQAVNMIARCAGGDKTYPLIGVYFEQMNSWAVNNPLPELFKIARQAGFTQESFDKCLSDQKLLDQILAYHRHASDKLGINGTPTFFVNGKRHLEAPTFEALEQAIKAHLPS